MEDSKPTENNGEDKYKDLSKEQLVEIIQGFQEMLRNQATREKFVKTVAQPDRKARISQNSTLSYYKPKFARIVQSAVDKILVEKRNRIFRYDSFPNNSETTLYHKIHQGMLYLVDNLDTADMKYARARDDIAIVKGKDGVRLEFTDDDLEDNSVPLEPTVNAAAKRREWKEKLQDFIDKSEAGQKLHIKNISLTEDEVEECNMMISGVEESFLFRFSATEILVIHNDNAETT